MIPTCLNHRQMTYDFCRNCPGRDLDCPEYLADIEHYTRQTKPDRVKSDNSRGENLRASSSTIRRDNLPRAFKFPKPFYWYHSSPTIKAPILPREKMFGLIRRLNDGGTI